MPQQCYPPAYSGECDAAEHNLKHCMAHAADPDAARVLYDSSRSREARIMANQRIQRKLKRNHVQCVP
jgi:lipopolysaccharide biosynthesis regulator YciM